MKLYSEIVDREVWKLNYIEDHQDLFEDEYADDFKKFDFTVLIRNQNRDKVCYSMVLEIDGDTAFLTFGGTFKKYRGMNLTTECLRKISECLSIKYKYIGFTCRTSNKPMIKVGLDCDYKIIGMQQIYGVPNLEFLLERGI